MKMAFIQVGSAVAPILTQLAQGLAIVAASVGKFISENQKLVVTVMAGGAAMFAAGTAITGVGYSLRGLSGGISLVLKGFALFSALASPVLLVAAGIGAAVFALYKFKDQIGAALGPVASLVQEAAGAIGEGFGPSVSDGIAVLGDLATTATTTFNGIYEAVAAGDLSGAMDILWAGLLAGWLRGVEALMSYVDPWVADFQNTFTYLGTEVAVAWESMTTALTSNEWGATLLGVVDNIVNGVMVAFDAMVAAVRKSWNYVQSFIVDGYDLAAENKKVDSEMSARARQRAVDRPGVEGRVQAAIQNGDKMRAESAGRVDAMRASANQIAQGRIDQNAQNMIDRRAATAAAEGNLASMESPPIDVASLASNISGAQSLDQLGKYGSQLSKLIEGDKITSEQEDALLAAYRDVQNGIATADALKKGTDTTSMGSVAGTFSSFNLAGSFGGSSLAERTAKAAEETAKNTRKIDDGGKVAA
jgi:hypothetical protein